MSATRFESEIVRLRLPGFMFARFGHAGLARHACTPDPTWQRALGGPDLDRYTWTTFQDDEDFPRAIGMRLTNALTHGQTFEVIEWYSPNRIVRGQWRLRPFGRWSELIDTG